MLAIASPAKLWRTVIWHLSHAAVREEPTTKSDIVEVVVELGKATEITEGPYLVGCIPESINPVRYQKLPNGFRWRSEP